MARYNVTIEIKVNDPRALRRAALANAIMNGFVDEEDYQIFLDNGHDSIADDLVTLLDPGGNLPGCSVEASSAEPVGDVESEHPSANQGGV